jgi:hypothetical protein
MSIYITRPKSLSGTLVSASFSGNLGSVNRQSQLNEVFAFRLSDPVNQEIRSRLSAPSGRQGHDMVQVTTVL